MGWPTIFANLSGGNQPLSIFDAMFQQVAQMIAIPCTASGTNSITVNPNPNCPTLNAYTDFCAVRFRAVNTSNGAVTANFMTLPNLPVYLSDGLTPAGAGAVVAGQEYVLVFLGALNAGSGGWFLEEAAVSAFPVAAGSSVGGLTIVNDGGTPNTKLDVSLSEVTVNNASGLSLRFGPQSFVIDLTTVGVPNGIDTTPIAANQNYYIYAISNGALLRGYISLQSTYAAIPLPPAGYVYSKLIGAWRSASGSAQLMGGRQGGTRFQYLAGVAQGIPAVLISNASGNPAGPMPGGWTSVATTTAVPPNNIRSVNVVLSYPNVASSGLTVTMAAPTNGFAAYGAAPAAPLALSGAQTFGSGVGQGPGINQMGVFMGVGPFFYCSGQAGTFFAVDGWDVNI